MLARLPTYGLKRVILWQKYKVKSGQYGVLTHTRVRSSKPHLFMESPVPIDHPIQQQI